MNLSCSGAVIGVGIVCPLGLGVDVRSGCCSVGDVVVVAVGVLESCVVDVDLGTWRSLCLAAVVVDFVVVGSSGCGERGVLGVEVLASVGL